LLPERLHEDSKVALKNIFGPLSNVLEELSNKEANDILVRASPKEVSDFVPDVMYSSQWKRVTVSQRLKPLEQVIQLFFSVTMLYDRQFLN
jgi:hypothetical protein